MISMSVVHSIRSMRKEGCSVAAIARELNVSEPTVRKYLKVRDLSPKPPVKRARPSKIDPWVPLIEQWLAEDRESWSKQRHTATRIHERLVHEHGADVSLSTVNRKVGELKRQFRLERESGFLDLSWHEAEAQADFGQTDVWWRGVRTRMRFFVLSFPYSNTAVACLTPGENAECTCAALRGLFERLGGRAAPHPCSTTRPAWGTSARTAGCATRNCSPPSARITGSTPVIRSLIYQRSRL